MICEHAHHHLDAYVRGELDAATAADVKAHLAACAACRNEEAMARRLAQGLRALHRDAPAALAARVLAARPQRRIAWFTPARALAATLLLAGIVFATSEGRQWFTKETYEELTSSPAEPGTTGAADDFKPSELEMKAAPALPALEPDKGKAPASALPAPPPPGPERQRQAPRPAPAPAEEAASFGAKSIAVPAAEALRYEAEPMDAVRRDQANEPAAGFAGGADASFPAKPAAASGSTDALPLSAPASTVAPAPTAPAPAPGAVGRTFSLTTTEEDKRQFPAARAPQRSLLMKESAAMSFSDQDSFVGAMRGDTGAVDTGAAAAR